MDHVVNILGIIVIGMVFCLLLVPHLEVRVVGKTVIPPAGVKIERWVDDFKRWAIYCIIVSSLLSLVWYIYGSIVKPVNWKESGKRAFWFLLFLISAIVPVLAIYFTRHAKKGAWFAYMFYVVNALVCYYFSTALFSPSSYKYTPLLASKLRKW